MILAGLGNLETEAFQCRLSLVMKHVFLDVLRNHHIFSVFGKVNAEIAIP